MFSEELTQYSQKVWEQAKPSLGVLGERLQQELEKREGEKRVLLELAFGTLPASDLASVPVFVLDAYAEHALMLRKTSAYCKDIPEDIFIHCVYYPRINSEDLVDCRKFFYDKLYPLVKGQSAVEAALAVNRWCAAQMTYEMTDTRSINPITAYYCGLGRCGEESTFGVTALRSVGLPARQIYVPWWSHCDDNHAWVEVYTGDGWHFLGACEPEPTLDRGWFVNASSRAMVACSRNFFSYVGEGLKQEALVQKKGICLAYNQIHRYAEAVPVTVTVRDAQGQPIEGAWVRFYVENMASASCIAALQTDAQGRVLLETGLGSCLVEAEFEQTFDWKTIQVQSAVELTLTPDKTEPKVGVIDWDFVAPETGHKHKSMLTPQQQAEKAQILQQANQQRRQRIESYWKPEYETGDPELDRVFRMAGGHAQALWEFYQQYGQEGKEMLLSLPSKDWRDADTQVLAAHIEAVRELPGQESAQFRPYVACPRIGFELLTDWRSAVQQALTQQEKERFQSSPAALWDWITENFREGDCRWHPVLWLQPGAALKLRTADARGRRLLFVAILRTFGVPARLDPMDGRAQYWQNDGFCTVEVAEPWEPKAQLKLGADRSMVYAQSWGLSRWNKGWQTLELEEPGRDSLDLPLGLYRLHTVNRLPNGNQLVQLNTFRVQQDRELKVQKRPAAPEQLLAHYQVELSVPTQTLELQLYLECGAEPTEHVLNELLDAADRVRSDLERGLNLRLLLPDERSRQDPTLNKVMERLPEVAVQQTDFSAGCLETLARALYLEPGLWPLMTLTDGSFSYYGNAGYAVGSVGLALELAELKLNQK